MLRGAERLVRRCKPVIVFEHGLGAADHYGTEPEHIHDLLTGYGLSIGLMGDWLAGRRDKVFSRKAFGDEFRQARNFYFIVMIPPSAFGAPPSKRSRFKGGAASGRAKPVPRRLLGARRWSLRG